LQVSMLDMSMLLVFFLSVRSHIEYRNLLTAVDLILHYVQFPWVLEWGCGEDNKGR
jgi:hypothetical protein